jgi:polysaccharide chain length determinant protein (PEP-CTERM system associated)
LAIPPHAEAYDLARVLKIVRRRWPVGLAALLVPLSAVVSLVAFLPRVYRASTVVLVDRQQVPETFVRSTVTSALETRLQSISQEVLSRGRLDELIERLGLYPELRATKPMEAVTEQMRRDIQIERVTDPVVRGGAVVSFTVSYTGRDPNTVAEVVNTLASLYLTENSRAREEEASGTAGFLRKQLDDVKKRLEDQEARVSAFKRRHIGENPKNMDANLAVLERLTAQLRLNSDNQNRALERREALSRQLLIGEGAVGTAGARGPVAGMSGVEVADPAMVRLARLHQELAELQTRFSDKYPDVVRLKAEIAALEEQLRDRPATASVPAQPAAPPNPLTFQLRQVIAELEAEIAALRSEERRLREDFATYQRRVENTPLREQEFQELYRDYETTSELYRTLLKRYEEAQLAETLEQRQKGEQFRILEPAIPPSTPSAPRRFTLLLLGGILSMAFATGVALLAEWLDGSLHEDGDLRRVTNVPVVGRIPRLVGEGDVARSRRRVMAWAGAMLVMVALTVVAAYATAKGHVPVASRMAHSVLLRS